MKKLTVTVNGQRRTAFIKDNEILLDVLRDKLGIKSVKAACWRGECGLCTVLADGKLVKSCLVLAVEADGSSILTAEGLAREHLSDIQEAFARYGASQCGFCTPAFILTCHYIIKNKKAKEGKEVLDMLNGLICRCGTYSQIREAVNSVISSL
jgi:carbon-monoxide dehydrogenase small subunit